jgi:hypothetical protein
MDKIQRLQEQSRDLEKVPPNSTIKMTVTQTLINFILIVCLFVKSSVTYHPNDVIVHNLRIYVEGSLILYLKFFFMSFLETLVVLTSFFRHLV